MPLHSYADLHNLTPSPQICKQYLFLTPDMQNLYRSPHMLASLPNPTCSPHRYANDYPQNIIFSPQTRKTSNLNPPDMQTTHNLIFSPHTRRTSIVHPTHTETSKPLNNSSHLARPLMRSKCFLTPN